MSEFDLTTASKAGQPIEEPKEDLTEREASYNVRIRGADGKVRTAVIVSRILTPDERLQVSRAKANLAGCPWEHLSPEDQGMIRAMALVGTQVRNIPGWLNRLACEDMDVLNSLYAVCAEHETRYFRGHIQEGAQDQKQPRISIAPTSASAPAAQ